MENEKEGKKNLVRCGVRTFLPPTPTSSVNLLHFVCVCVWFPAEKTSWIKEGNEVGGDGGRWGNVSGSWVQQIHFFLVCVCVCVCTFIYVKYVMSAPNSLLPQSIVDWLKVESRLGMRMLNGIVAKVISISLLLPVRLLLFFIYIWKKNKKINKLLFLFSFFSFGGHVSFP